MAQVILGSKRAPGNPPWRTIPKSGGTNTQALTRVVPSEPLWVTHLGVYAKRDGNTNADIQIALYAGDGAGGAPGTLLAYTATFRIGKTASQRQAALAWSARGAALGWPPAAAALAAGQVYWLAIQAEGGDAAVSTVASGPAPLIYTRQSSGNPPASFGAGATASARPCDIWAMAETDNAPVAALTGPATTIASANPTFTGTFTDADAGAPYADRMSGYRIELRQKAAGALLWTAEPTATAAERTANTFSKTYDGAALAEDDYEWRALVIDDVGVASDYTAWRDLTLSDLGSIDSTNSIPTGKIEYGIVSGNWTGRWQSGLGRSADGALVRVLASGTVIRGGDAADIVTLSPTVAPNAFISLTNAQANVATSANPLPAGIYTWQMQARDTSGNLSLWSAEVPLTINAAPDQPAGLRPPSGSTLAARPTLEWLISDPDIDDVPGAGVSSIVEVTRPDTSISTTETLDIDPATGRGYLVVTAPIAPGNGTYQWRVRGRDLSAAGTPAEYGPWSAPAVFELITAPIVTVTAPTEGAILPTSTPQFQWSVTDGTMTFYEVRLYRAGQPAAFYSTGKRALANPSINGSWVQPAGWLKNGLTYELDVTIWTGGGIASTSPRRGFRVSYADANLIGNVAANTRLNRRDVEPTSIVISWESTSYPAAQFGGYVVWRRRADDDPDAAIPIARLRQSGQTQYIDHHAPPNTPLVYAVSQLRLSGPNVHASALAEVDAEVDLSTPVLASLLSGETIRAPVKWLETGISGGFERKDGLAETWGSRGRKVWVRTPPGHGARTFSLGWTIRSDDEGTLEEHLADVAAMMESGDPFSLRTETDVSYVRIAPGNYWKRGRDVGTIDISLSLEEIAWNEAVPLPA